MKSKIKKDGYSLFLAIKECKTKKLKLNYENDKTISEEFDEFIDICNSKKLRPATLKHYRESWKQISKYIDISMEVSSITKKTIADVIIKMKQSNIRNQTLYTYVRDSKTISHFFMEQGYIVPFKVELPKVDSKPIEPYTDDEIKKLISKP